jgi:uncharacterized protein YpmB
MKNKKQKILTGIAIVVIVLIVIVSGFFIFRDQILQQSIARTTIQLNKNTIVLFTVKDPFCRISG